MNILLVGYIYIYIGVKQGFILLSFVILRMERLDMAVMQENEKEKEDAYFNFINSIKSGVTKEIYQYNIKLFMKFCSTESYDALMQISNPQTQIIKYLISLKEKGLSSNSISTRLNAIYHFYDMNDVALNKKKINMFKGESSRKVVDRAYTYEEIKKILDVSDLRQKTITLLMASCGMRIGALPSLRLRNLQKIENSIYKITVYEGSNSQYDTFCTPECSNFIDAYLDYRTRNGEKLESNSFLIRDQFDITDLEQIRNKSKGISISTIGNLLDVILLKAGIRSIDHTSQFNRKEVARAHGFRRFFTTQLINSKVNSEIREMLLGHKIGLASCYYRPTQEDMLKEYEKAIDALTINEENRLKRKVKTLEIEKSRVDELEETVKALKEQFIKPRK
jgi:integrase